MKPVIKKQTHYSLLLMRDDKSVYDLRVKTTTVRACIILFILLLLGGGGGIAGGLHYWKKYRALYDQHKEQDVELAEARLQLEHYVNREALEKEKSAAAAAPTAKNVEIGAEARAQKTLQAANATAHQSANATVPSADSAARGATPAGGVAETPAAAQPDASASAENAQPQSSSLNHEHSPLRISNFSGRPSGYQRLRLNYELSTPEEKQPPVSGLVKYTAVFSNGTQLPLDLQRSGDARFTISRMKQMEGSVRLPQGHAAKDIESIDITVEMEGGARYRDIYPFTR